MKLLLLVLVLLVVPNGSNAMDFQGRCTEDDLLVLQQCREFCDDIEGVRLLPPSNPSVLQKAAPRPIPCRVTCFEEKATTYYSYGSYEARTAEIFTRILQRMEQQESNTFHKEVRENN